MKTPLFTKLALLVSLSLLLLACGLPARGVQLFRANATPSRSPAPQATISPVPRAADAVTQPGGVYTRTLDNRADWEQGKLDWLDSVTISGSLRLAQRFFGENTTITPRAELHSGHWAPAIGMDGNGDATAVWIDWRNGNPDIYSAYTPAGGAPGPNVKVNDDTDVAGQSDLALAVDRSGNAYAMWADERNGNTDIYFAYRPTDDVWSANVKVNDDAGLARQSLPDIAVDKSGNLYAVWADGRNGNEDIYFAYRPVGGEWNANVRVNDDVGAARQQHPAIAVDSGGNAYAVWEDERNGSDGDIYFAYRPTGGNWSANVQVSDDAGKAIQGFPDIAVDGSGNAYAVWEDSRIKKGDIYFAYRPAGVSSAWGTNVKVSSGTGKAKWWLPPASIAVDGSGNAYAVWTDRRNGHLDIYSAYRPAGAGSAWGVNVKVNNDTGRADQDTPAIAVDDSGNVSAAWMDSRNGYGDIYFARRPAGADGKWSANVQVNDDPGAGYQEFPDIAVDGNGNAYAAWSDDRNGYNEDIYFAYRPAGGAWETNVRVNDDAGTTNQYSPAIAVDRSGNAYAIWRDWRANHDDIYFAYHPAGAGGSWSANVRVNDVSGSTSGPYPAAPALAVDENGNAYALWEDGRNGNYDIYFAYRPAGGNWSVNARVNDDTGTAEQASPALAVDSNGNAYAVWQDSRNGVSADIYFAYRPAGAGGAWGANVKINDDAGAAKQYSPAIAVDGNGNAYAVWTDERSGTGGDLYCADRPAGASSAWGANVQVNDDAGTASRYTPDLAVDGNNHIFVVWQDRRSGRHAIYFAYRPASGAWSTNIRVNDDSGYADPDSPAIAVDGSGHAYTVWGDYRYGAGNVYFASSLPMPEYASVGVYTSPELDTGVDTALWGSLTYSATVPAGAALTVETRSRLARGAWSAWQLPGVDRTIVSPPGQRLQYRVTFHTTLTNTTPVLDWARVTYRSAEALSAPRFATPCGVTNRVTPTLQGMAAAASLVRLYVDGIKVATTTVGAEGTFTLTPSLSTGSHVLTATTENANGISPASASLPLTVTPALTYDPIGVRAGPWSRDGWQLSAPRDAAGCANPENNWRISPQAGERFRVQVPVSYTASTVVTITLGAQTITLTEESHGLYAGVFQSSIQGETIVQVGTASIPSQPAHEAQASAASWQFQTVYSAGNPLVRPQGLVLDKEGVPHIVFRSSGGLQYAKWSPTARTWDISTIDSSSSSYPSLALDAAGSPHVAYIYTPPGGIIRLRYASWDASAGTWQVQMLDNKPSFYPSLALDKAGYPHISYGDMNNGDLKYVYWDASANQWRFQTVDSAGVVGLWTVIKIDALGRPHIAYYDQTNGNPKYAYWDASTWHIETVADEQWVSEISMALDKTASPHLSYLEPSYDLIKYAHRNPDTGQWQVQSLGLAYDAGTSSLALDKDGNPGITYEVRGLQYTYRDPQTGAWKTETVDPSSRAGSSSLVIDDQGNPHIAYTDGEGGRVLYAWRESAPASQ